MNDIRESIQFDCSRGCIVSHDAESGETSCTYRAGCCKLGDYNWLKDAQDGSCDGLSILSKGILSGVTVSKVIPGQ